MGKFESSASSTVSFKSPIIAEQRHMLYLKAEAEQDVNFMMGYYFAFIFRNFKCTHTKVSHLVFVKYYQ